MRSSVFVDLSSVFVDLSFVFVDLSFIFRMSFKRSLFVRCTFNTCFVLAFALTENGKGTFKLKVWLLAVDRAAERRTSEL